MSQAVCRLKGSLPTKLSPREMETLLLICCGLRDRDIAEMMGIPYQVVKNIAFAIRNKIGCDTRVGMVLHAIRRG